MARRHQPLNRQAMTRRPWRCHLPLRHIHPRHQAPIVTPLICCQSHSPRLLRRSCLPTAPNKRCMDCLPTMQSILPPRARKRAFRQTKARAMMCHYDHFHTHMQLKTVNKLAILMKTSTAEGIACIQYFTARARERVVVLSSPSTHTHSYIYCSNRRSNAERPAI